jgi:hypothetical protein
MDWKEALTQLVDVAPKLAFKPELIAALQASAKAPTPPPILPVQLEVMMAVVKQNRRIADLHGYPSLDAYAKRVEVAIQNVVSALKGAGLLQSTTKSAQAGLV